MITVGGETTEIAENDVRHNSSSRRQVLRFLAVFASLLMAAEILLRGIRSFHLLVENILASYHLSLAFVQFGVTVAINTLALVCIIGLFVFIEWRQLRFENFKERYRDGILFNVVALIISMVVQALEFSLFRQLGLRPLVSAEALSSMLFLVPACYILFLGFLEYWLHRALHHYEFLWRFHAVHHQIEHLNAARSYSHFGEKVIYILVITTPLILLVEAPQTQIALVTTFYIISNHYMHSDSPSLSFPAPLRHIFADNVYHHYHHVRDARFFGKNYASFFSFYDRLFGTQHMPLHEEFPETGIDGYVPITTLGDYIQRPFRRS